MGIPGLLPVLKSASSSAHISDFKGKRAGVDGYSWLHKAAFSCALELCLGQKTDRYVWYCLRRAKFLEEHGVTPVIVFDGGRLPMKADTEAARRAARLAHLEKGKQALALGDRATATAHFQKAVSITSEMVFRVIQVLKQHQIESVVAPYEADAQLAFLAINQHIDVVITEDSDLLAYGCPQVFFKMDKDGNGVLIRYADITSVRDGGVTFANWTDDMFTEMCVLSGCDFLDSPQGMGVKTANKLINKFKSFDRAYHFIKTTFVLGQEYFANFYKAFQVFRHQRVYNTKEEKICHLRDLTADLEGLKLDYLGGDYAAETAQKVSRGEVDPTTHKPFAIANENAIPSPRKKWQQSPQKQGSSHGVGGGSSGVSYSVFGKLRGRGRGLIAPPQQRSVAQMFTVTQSQATKKPFRPPQSVEINTDVKDIERLYTLPEERSSSATTNNPFVTKYAAIHMGGPQSEEDHATRISQVHNFLFGARAHTRIQPVKEEETDDKHTKLAILDQFAFKKDPVAVVSHKISSTSSVTVAGAVRVKVDHDEENEERNTSDTNEMTSNDVELRRKSRSSVNNSSTNPNTTTHHATTMPTKRTKTLGVPRPPMFTSPLVSTARQTVRPSTAPVSVTASVTSLFDKFKMPNGRRSVGLQRSVISQSLSLHPLPAREPRKPSNSTSNPNPHPPSSLVPLLDRSEFVVSDEESTVHSTVRSKLNPSAAKLLDSDDPMVIETTESVTMHVARQQEEEEEDTGAGVGGEMKPRRHAAMAVNYRQQEDYAIATTSDMTSLPVVFTTESQSQQQPFDSQISLSAQNGSQITERQGGMMMYDSEGRAMQVEMEGEVILETEEEREEEGDEHQQGEFDDGEDSDDSSLDNIDDIHIPDSDDELQEEAPSFDLDRLLEKADTDSPSTSAAVAASGSNTLFTSPSTVQMGSFLIAESPGMRVDVSPLIGSVRRYSTRSQQLQQGKETETGEVGEGGEEGEGDKKPKVVTDLTTKFSV